MTQKMSMISLEVVLMAILLFLPIVLSHCTCTCIKPGHKSHSTTIVHGHKSHGTILIHGETSHDTTLTHGETSDGMTPIPGDNSQGTTPVPTDNSQGTTPVPNDKSQNMTHVPNDKSQGTPPVPNNKSQDTTPVPNDKSQGTPPVPTNKSQGTPSVTTDKSQGTPSVSTEKSQGMPPVPTDKSQGTPSVPTEKSQGTSTDKSQGTPPVPTNKSQGTPPVPTDKSQDTPPVPTDKSQSTTPVPMDKSKDTTPVPTDQSQDTIPISTDQSQGTTPVPADKPQGATPIPADKTQLNWWFEKTVGSISSRQGSLDSDLSVAEANVKTIKVSADGKGDFKTIINAINSIPAGNKNRVIIMIGPGTYTGNIKIDKSKRFITLYGDSNNMPTLVCEAASNKYGMTDDATLIVEADYFVGVNLNIKTSVSGHITKGINAKALRIAGDKIAFHKCKLYGLQNTISDKGKHFFKDCYIEGSVDFLFGGGKSLYLNSETRVMPCNPMEMIKALPIMTSSEELGYSFVHCTVTGIDAISQLSLARMAYPRIVFAYSELNDALNFKGWFKSITQLVNHRTLFFGEFENKGSGSGLFKSCPFAKILGETTVKGFISLDFVEGSKWLLPLPKCA